MPGDSPIDPPGDELRCVFLRSQSNTFRLRPRSRPLRPDRHTAMNLLRGVRTGEPTMAGHARTVEAAGGIEPPYGALQAPA